MSSARHFLEPALNCQGDWGLRIERTGEWVAPRARLAGTSAERRRGLLGRLSMGEGEALVIAPSQAVHTFGMRFALDVVGVKRNGDVVSVKKDVPARRIVVSARAFAIVELPAGASDRCGLIAGDRLVAVARPSDGLFPESLTHGGE